MAPKKRSSTPGSSNRSLTPPVAPTPAVAQNWGQEKVAARENKWAAKLERAKWAVYLFGGFLCITYLGHAYVCLLVIVAQFESFKEVADVRIQAAEKASQSPKKMPLFRTIQLSSFFFAIFDTWGSSIVAYFKIHPDAAGWLNAYLHYHNVVSKSLYAMLFMVMVLSFRMKQVRFQLEQYLWVGLTLVIVVFSLKYTFTLIYCGLFWFVLSLLLVITNDTMAYFAGMTTGKRIFGKRVFLEFSPNKTWEGFIGGAFFTVVLSPLIAHWLSSYQWMVCPGEMTMVPHAALTCKTPPAFQPGPVDLPLLGNFTYAQWHALCLGAVASIVAPFGGFLASAIKRAYDIKDFADKIPGHGGVMDRIDCQLVMIFLTSTYLRSFLWEEFSVSQVAHHFSLLSASDKVAALDLIQKIPKL